MLAVLGLMLAALLVAPPLWIAFHLRDLPAPVDSDLALRVPESALPLEELEALRFERLHWPEGTNELLRDFQPRSTWESARVRELVRENWEAFAALARMLEGPPMGLAVGEFAAIDPQFDALLGAQQLAKIAAAEAKLLHRAGDSRAALERALLGMRVGRKICEAHGVNLLALMFAASSQGTSLMAVERHVREMRFTPGEARALAAELRWETAAWERAWAAEYQYLKTTVENVDASLESEQRPFGGGEGVAWHVLAWLPVEYAWQSNRTLSELARGYRELQRHAGLDCRQVQSRLEERVVPERLPLHAVLRPNPVGRHLLEVSGPILVRFDTRRCHFETRVGLVKAQIALKAYWDAHGALPERFDALVPDYLDSVPIDRFDGAPLRYDGSRAVVYSVGNDFIDAGTPDPPEQTRASAPGVSVAF